MGRGGPNKGRATCSNYHHQLYSKGVWKSVRRHISRDEATRLVLTRIRHRKTSRSGIYAHHTGEIRIHQGDWIVSFRDPDGVIGKERIKACPNSSD